MKQLQSDILIVGAGLSGLLAAYALSSTNKQIIVIDRFSINSLSIKSDLRTTAIAEGSKIFLEKLVYGVI